jgi:two-component system, sensor histidine kinase RegB
VLTGLLQLTGGPFNPFAVVYAIHVAQAAVALGRTPTAMVAVCVAVCCGTLLYWHTLEADAEHHRLTDFPTHLFTMWVVIVSLAELVAFYVVQTSNALSRREHALETMRDRAARSDRIASLTTLAAGAAHELSTPLGTIAVVARELERAIERTSHAIPSASSALLDDARLIRTEVDRCCRILDQMSGRAGGIAADVPEPVHLGRAIESVAAQLPPEQARRLSVRIAEALPDIHVPRAGLVQVLSSVIGNAFDASPVSQPVVVEAALDGPGGVQVRVQDRGPGMSAEVLQRAGEPFYTTKEPSKGLGLGLFLARAFAERCGGTLTLASDGGGTIVALGFPAR